MKIIVNFRDYFIAAILYLGYPIFLILSFVFTRLCPFLFGISLIIFGFMADMGSYISPKRKMPYVREN